jgi:hypothetical protein
VAKCVSCRIEARREWLHEFARRSNRIASRLKPAAVGCVVAGMILGSLWHLERTSVPPVSSFLTGWITVALVAIAAVSGLGWIVTALVASLGRRVGARPTPHVTLPPEAPSAPVVDPASGSAYRSATVRIPVAPPPLCGRHEALARQNRNRPRA